MNIKSCMKHVVVSIPATATIRETAEVFVKNHIGLLPVVDENGNPIGILSLHDLLTLELPDFVSFVADLDFVHDFGAVETTRPSAEALNQPVTVLMETTITIPEDCGLLRAYAMMLQHKLYDIPVVSKKGKLVGIVSHVDIGTAILTGWYSVE